MRLLFMLSFMWFTLENASAGTMSPSIADENTNYRKGLVSEVVASDALIARAVEVASSIAARSVAITPYAKRAVQAAFELPLAEGLLEERRLTVEAFATEDRMEGLRAFAEKRAPVFKGR